MYDDYQFVSKKDVETIGLSHLIGTNLLRAYMHGYFMDIRLYRKAKQQVDPFNYEEFKRNKIKEAIDKERINRVKVHKLPKVNAELARKVIEETKLGKSKTTPKTRKFKCKAYKNCLCEANCPESYVYALFLEFCKY